MIGLAPPRPSSCLRCGEPFVRNEAVLADARHAGIALDFVPLRCRYGHTARIEQPQPHLRYVPICGYCDKPVLVFRTTGRGAPYLNHPACYDPKNKRVRRQKNKPFVAHQYIAVSP